MNPTREGRGAPVEEVAAVTATGATVNDQAIIDAAVAAADDSPVPAHGADPEAAERELRGRLYQELDLLAYALEMEVSEALGRGDEAEAARAQQTRLGIRLAQRLVGDVPAPEVDRRLDRWRVAYLAKFPYG